MFYKVIIFSVTLMLFSSVKAEESQVSQEQIQELREYITNNYQSPEDYVIDKFNDHKVVILGEWHYIKHDPILIQKLIPILHKNGIYYLAYEFIRREDQFLIDSLLQGEQYDENLALFIDFKKHVDWGHSEYIDIFRAAWDLNHSLNEDEKPFTILGVNDSPDWSIMQTQEDRETDSLKRLVWQGGGEKYWAEIILKKVKSGEKILVYSGMHHAFSEFLQPVIKKDMSFARFVKNRMGRYIYNEIGKDVITIYMHGPWRGEKGYSSAIVRPADGVIDMVMESLGNKFKPVGFDIKDSPFGKLEPKDAIYMHGYNPFALEKYCDGWIYTKPFSEYQSVSYIDGFINENNIKKAQQQSPDPYFRDKSIEEFEESIKRYLLDNIEKINKL